MLVISSYSKPTVLSNHFKDPRSILAKCRLKTLNEHRYRYNHRKNETQEFL
jgi:hypothetical protein